MTGWSDSQHLDLWDTAPAPYDPTDINGRLWRYTGKKFGKLKILGRLIYPVTPGRNAAVKCDCGRFGSDYPTRMQDTSMCPYCRMNEIANSGDDKFFRNVMQCEPVLQPENQVDREKAGLVLGWLTYVGRSGSASGRDKSTYKCRCGSFWRKRHVDKLPELQQRCPACKMYRKAMGGAPRTPSLPEWWPQNEEVIPLLDEEAVLLYDNKPDV